MKKDFDCVEMKRKIQEKIYEETKDFSTEELLDYYHKGGERFERKMEAMHEKKDKEHQKKVIKAKSGKRKSSVNSLKSKS